MGKPNIYEVTRSTAAAFVRIQRQLHDVGLHATASKVNEASQKLGWEAAEKMERVSAVPAEETKP